MEKLSFKLISNKETIIDETVNYFIKDKVLNFKIDKNVYQYDLSKNLLEKKDKDANIIFDIKKHKLVIELLKEDTSFDMPIIDTSLEHKDKIITIKYTIEDENKITNTIIIKY